MRLHIATLTMLMSGLAMSSQIVPSQEVHKQTAHTVSSSRITPKPSPDRDVPIWEISVSRTNEGTPSSAVKLKVGAKHYAITKGVSGEMKLMDADSMKAWKIPAKAVTACFGWYAGGGDAFYVIRAHQKLRVYHRTMDEGDEKQPPDALVVSIRQAR